MRIATGKRNFAFYTKIIALVVSVVVICFLLYMAIALPHTQKDTVPMVFSAFEFMIFLLIIWVCIQQLRYLSISVVVDTDAKTLEVGYFLATDRLLYAAEISAYATTTILSKGATYKGLLLTDDSGRRILISEFSLKEIGPVVSFLKDENVPCSGGEQIKLEQYYKQARG